MKRCGACGGERPFSDYASHKQTKDRLQPWCRPCFAVYGKEYRKRNPETVRATSGAWTAANRERVNACARNRRAADPEKFRAAVRKSHQKNAERIAKWLADNRERVNATLSRWKRRNRHVVAMDSRQRVAARLQAVPGWADKSVIRDIYRQASLAGMTVDHIVPLRSKRVCGLHCEANLQVISLSDNARKNNRHWPDMP